MFNKHYYLHYAESGLDGYFTQYEELLDVELMKCILTKCILL